MSRFNAPSGVDVIFDQQYAKALFVLGFIIAAATR
jgi:hypothetical protein